MSSKWNVEFGNFSLVRYFQLEFQKVLLELMNSCNAKFSASALSRLRKLEGWNQTRTLPGKNDVSVTANPKTLYPMAVYWASISCVSPGNVEEYAGLTYFLIMPADTDVFQRSPENTLSEADNQPTRQGTHSAAAPGLEVQVLFSMDSILVLCTFVCPHTLIFG